MYCFGQTGCCLWFCGLADVVQRNTSLYPTGKRRGLKLYCVANPLKCTTLHFHCAYWEIRMSSQFFSHLFKVAFCCIAIVMFWWTNNRLYLKDGHCIIIHCLNFSIFSSRFNLVASKETTLVRFVSNINFLDGLYRTARCHISEKITLKSSKKESTPQTWQKEPVQ